MTGRTDHYRRCGEWMPRAKQTCARLDGHADGHRTRAALDDESQAKRGHMPYPYILRAGEWVAR